MYPKDAGKERALGRNAHSADSALQFSKKKKVSPRYAALRTHRASLLQRVRSELRMKIALELLLRYDPEGDHKTLVELPTSYAEDVARLRAEKVELAGVVDSLLGRLLSVGSGGEASA